MRAKPRRSSSPAVMPSDDGDEASVQSARSKRSSIVPVASGPCTVNGVTFLKVKRCPMCNCLNSDPNPILRGPRGIEAEPFLMWHKGTQQNPEGRFDRICVNVFAIAGFAHEFPNVDAFLEARKGNPNLQREWKAAYDEYLAVLSEGHSRLRGGVKSFTLERVSGARKKVVKAFATTQVKASSKFRAVKREKYEQTFPGRIAKMGLKTQFIKCDGVPTEVVLLRETPQDEWDVEVDDIQGVAQEEEHEDSSAFLRAEQANVKFESLAKASRAAFQGGQNMLTLQEGMAPAEDEQDVSEVCDDTLLEGEVSDEEGDSDDDLAWATTSLLTSPLSSFGGKPASSKPCGRSKAAAARSWKPSPTASSSRISVASSATSTKKTADATPTKADNDLTTPKKSGRGRAAISAKLATQGTEQVLGSHGLDEVKGFVDEISRRLTFKPFTTILRGADHAKYVQDFAEVKKIAQSAQKAAVALDIKVKKWREVSEEVQQLLARHRAMTSAYADCFMHFGVTTKKGNDISKMEKTSAACQACGIEMPLAFKSLLFLEKSQDLLRFQEIELFTLFLNIEKDQGGFFAEETPEAKETVRPLILEAIGDGVNLLAQGVSGAADVAQDSHKKVMELAYQLSMLTPDTLDDDARNQLALLATSMGQGSPSPEEREAASAELADLAQDAGYSGVLKPVLSDAAWPVLQQLSEQFNKVDEAQGLANTLAKEFEKTSQHVYTASDKASFMDVLVRALASYDKCERKKPVMKKLEMTFAAMAQQSSEGLRNCQAELAMLCKHLAAGPAGSGNGIKHSMVADGFACSARDIIMKRTFNMSPIFKHLDEGPKQLLATGGLSKYMELLESKLGDAQCVLSLMEQLIKLHALSTSMNLQKEEEEKSKGLAEMVELLSKIKAECAAMVDRGDNLLAADVEAYTSKCNVHNAGCEIYTEKLESFQSAVLGMIDGFLLRHSKFDPAIGSTAITTNSKLVAAASHQLSQLAAWSDTPVHDQACIRFASMELRTLCDKGVDAAWMSEPTGAKFKPDMVLRQALAVVSNLELSKPKLVWLVGGDASQKFLDYVRELFAATGPAEAAYVKGELGQLRGSMSKLQKLLVPVASSSNDNAFHAALSNSSAAKLRAARKETKQFMDTLEPFKTEDDGNAVVSTLAEAQKMIDEAKHQTIKWGLLSFILHPEIRTATSVGLDLRAKLKNVWHQHMTDAEVMGYIGSATQQCVAEVLATDQATKPPRPQRGLKRQVDDPSSAAAKVKARR